MPETAAERRDSKGLARDLKVSHASAIVVGTRVAASTVDAMRGRRPRASSDPAPTMAAPLARTSKRLGGVCRRAAYTNKPWSDAFRPLANINTIDRFIPLVGVHRRTGSGAWRALAFIPASARWSAYKAAGPSALSEKQAATQMNWALFSRGGVG